MNIDRDYPGISATVAMQSAAGILSSATVSMTQACNGSPSSMIVYAPYTREEIAKLRAKLDEAETHLHAHCALVESRQPAAQPEEIYE